MPDLSFLDPVTSSFMTMLQRLGPPHLEVEWRPGMYVGALLRDRETGELWRVSYVKRKNPDDWFSDEQVAICHKPWVSVQERAHNKIEWLEDKLFPRVSA